MITVKNYIYGVVTVLIFAAIATGAYYFGFNKANKKPTPIPTNTTENNQLNTTKPTQTTQPTVQPTQQSNVIQQVIAVIQTMNTQPMETYMAETVQVRLENSGCCGPISKSEAIQQLSYLQPATGWDFNQSNPIIVQLAAAMPDYYGSGWTVGVASNKYVFSFKLNNQNQVDAYNIGASYELLLQ